MGCVETAERFATVWFRNQPYHIMTADEMCVWSDVINSVCLIAKLRSFRAPNPGQLTELPSAGKPLERLVGQLVGNGHF